MENLIDYTINLAVVAILFIVFKFVLKANFKKRIVKSAIKSGGVCIYDAMLGFEVPPFIVDKGFVVSPNSVSDCKDPFIFFAEISFDVFFVGSHFLSDQEILSLFPKGMLHREKNFLVFPGWKMSEENIKYLLERIRELSEKEIESCTKFVLTFKVE